MKYIFLSIICTIFSLTVNAELTVTNSGTTYLTIENGTKIVSRNLLTGKEKDVVLDLAQIRECPIESFQSFILSPIESHILLVNNNYYYLYDIHYQTIVPICDDQLEAAEFSPTGYMIAFARENNLYLYKLKYSSISSITTDGQQDSIRNGMATWMYEEEFNIKKCFFWSNDGQDVAFLKFENLTPDYTFAGTEIPKVSINIFNVESRRTKTIPLNEKNFYIPRLFWTPNEHEIGFIKLNRRQNELEVMVANSLSTVTKSLLTDRNVQYIDPTSWDVRFTDDGKYFLYIGQLAGHLQLSLYGTNGLRIRQLSKGIGDVTAICGYDHASRKVYYQATENAITRDIYCVSVEGGEQLKVSTETGYNEARLLKNTQYYLGTFSSHNTPETVSLCDLKGKTVRTISQEQHRPIVHQREYQTLKLKDGTELNCWIIKPKTVAPQGGYPLMIFQYSGPEFQAVLDRYDHGWEQQLVEKGYAVLCVDPRGTAGRGEDFAKCTYQKLGLQQSDDLIEVVQLVSQYPSINKDRIGLFGWSFGGYMTALTMCRTDAFKLGIAIAPVTDWHTYDAAYTERYMRTPEENIDGYDRTSVVKMVANLHGRLFLIHALDDENVIVKNHFDLTESLINAGKQFDEFIYPKGNHSLINQDSHLYQMLISYIEEKL